MENAALLLLVGVGAYYFLSNQKGALVFRDINGNAITEITCGNAMTFEVSGYSRVWLSQLKNGALDFDGPFNVPMPPYIVSCSNDVGKFDLAVYEIAQNDVKGKLIGQTTFTIKAQA